MSAPAASDPAATTEGHLLDGRVAYRQFAHGYRTGIEPVLMAAAVPARPGQRVLEAGCGAGAGLLCLAHRVPGVLGTGVEKNTSLAALAIQNVRTNALEGSLSIVTDSIEAVAAHHPGPKFHHLMANPPWHDPAGTIAAEPGRQTAKFAHGGMLADWIAALARLAAPQGSLHLMLAAANLDAAIGALAACGCGSLEIRPLWPRSQQSCRILLLSARRGGRAPTSLLSGLLLHEPGGPSPAAEAILRNGQAWHGRAKPRR